MRVERWVVVRPVQRVEGLVDRDDLPGDVQADDRRPTVDDNGAPLLETFVFDFSGDLYGEICQVSFFGFLRSEIKFDGLDALVAQMKRDEAEARALLAGVRPLSDLDRAIAC